MKAVTILMAVGSASAMNINIVSRRAAIGLAAAAGSAPAFASSDWDPKTDFMVGPEKNAISDYEVVATQQRSDGKIDVNNALVTDYKNLPGALQLSQLPFLSKR